MNNYKAALAKALEPEHQGPPDALSKAELENLSETTYKSIKKAGGFVKGKALSQLKF